MSGAQVHLLDTPPGPARVHLWCPLRARGEQPWLVAGRKIATRPPVLDAAWEPLVAGLRGPGGLLPGLSGPLVVAGRSAGARVACRTAVALGASGVLALSFPLHPPGKPAADRRDELAGHPVEDVQKSGLPGAAELGGPVGGGEVVVLGATAVHGQQRCGLGQVGNCSEDEDERGDQRRCTR